MNKTELLSIYTPPQLADMVVRLQNASEVKNDEIHKLKWQISSLEEENGRLQSKLDTYNNYLLPRCTKEAKEMIDHNHFIGVRIVTWEQWNNRGEKSMNISDIQKCQDEYEKLLKESPLEGVMNKITKDILEQKNNAMAMKFTRIICDLLKRYGVYVHCTETKFSEKITTNSIEEQYGIVFDSIDFSQHDKEFMDKIKELEEELEKSNREHAKTLWEFCDSVKKEDYEKEINHPKSEVEKYRKAFEDAKKERDCQVSEYRKKIDDLEHDLKTAGEKIQDLVGENMKLQCERNDYKSKSEFLEVERIGVKKNEFSDFLPTEPIKVADILINAEGEYERNPLAKAFCGTDKGTYRIFDVSELRQIAEHLLIYCNHNKEEEE